ncbi:protease complex subunit PrcB family protein [candidate division WOR-3 bacterium]|uniref:Protease complex subunit PrcB family protein n=1 Tax=candidate division WOR-3 bacterium TaxID=2052148 RepID=A0A9D5KAK9_UNCW3|nr:protease complex subunit PrcB family protein [candidate division WOR-3 bacterium]MBD3365431.1 protease complex subunit PrcB family protein [candidate division WOR-3 bacterium]
MYQVNLCYITSRYNDNRPERVFVKRVDKPTPPAYTPPKLKELGDLTVFRSFKRGDLMDRKLTAGLIAAFVLLSGCPGKLCLKPVESVTTIKCGELNYPESGNMVFRDAESWESFWNNHCNVSVTAGGEEPQAPEVDFESRMLVCVFAGEKPTAGYGISISRVREGNKSLVVEYSEKSPDPEKMVAQVVTYPCHIVAVPLSEKTVEFKEVDK